MSAIPKDILDNKQVKEILDTMDYTKRKVVEYEIRYREEMMNVLRSHATEEWTDELDECLWFVEMHSVMTMKKIAEQEKMSTREVSRYIRKGLGLIINFLDSIATDLEDEKNLKAYIYFRDVLNACPIKTVKKK